MNHKLFIVEGLPCSSKSTTSRYIADLLKANNHSVQWIDEETNLHPAEYEFLQLLLFAKFNV